jgi:glycosyltransferase involved in cell wall biosynthesis
MMGLSVVTITFNDFEGLLKTAETMPDNQIEWIVVDGSSDSKQRARNRSLLKKFSCILIQEPDTGRFYAMNKGLERSTGNLICFMNSGDAFASKEVATKILRSAHENKWAWAVGQTVAVDQNGDVLWPWLMPNFKSLRFKLSLRAYSHQATVYRTELLRSFGGFYEDSLYSDWLVSLQLSKVVPPFEDPNLWCRFLSGGISSQQTIKFWRKECIRLRRLKNLQISGFTLIDWTLQTVTAFLLRIDRKSSLLFRPDLKKNL